MEVKVSAVITLQQQKSEHITYNNKLFLSHDAPEVILKSVEIIALAPCNLQLNDEKYSS